MAFSMALNCTASSFKQTGNDDFERQPEKEGGFPTEPCLSCRSCKKIQTGNHPDIIQIEPSGTFIKVDQIRSLCRMLSLRPYEARQRVVIITDAHTMNPAAGNALLKVLEEPPDQTMLILTAIRISDLLPTIVSRCQQVRFNPISRENLQTLLMEREGVDAEDAAVLAGLSHGSFSKALLLGRTNWINRRKWLIHVMDRIMDRAGGPDPAGLLLAVAERLSKNKETLFESLEIIQSWLRDLVIWKYRPEKIINRDCINRIQHLSERNTAASIMSKMEAIREARNDIRNNVNLRLTLEVLVIRMATP
jgi:DNA polymerase-3 subunit delta'